MNYSQKLRYVQEKIQEYITTILKVYGNELVLLLEDYNLLDSPDNCIESSTAPGFVLEEFIISKLVLFTQGHDGDREIILRRNEGSTTAKSYDCYVEYKDVKILINHKAEKSGVNNSGVAAINKLYTDYVQLEPLKEKAFLVLKLSYRYIVSQRDGQRKFYISGINSVYLEEIDFSGGYRQDYRNWSKEFKSASGRLMLDRSFIGQHHLPDEQMSHTRTKEFIVGMMDQDDE